MKIAFYNGVSGMLSYQEAMNRVAHNVANSGTIGFKPDQSVFSDLLYTRMAVNTPEEPPTGHGVKIEDTRLVYRQGALDITGEKLDFAMTGDGLFAVRRPDGTTEYTRAGAFDISIEGKKKGYLVTGDGSHVLGPDGKPVELTRESDDGPFDLEGLKDKIGIYDFPNPYGLEHSSGVCFRETETSGAAVAINGKRSGSQKEVYPGRIYNIREGALERSAVDLSDEMVGVIVSQRAFQLNARMVQTADELEQVINNLR